MLTADTLAKWVKELGGNSNAVVQIGTSTDRYCIEGIQYEHSGKCGDLLVIKAGQKVDFESRISNLEKEYREYLFKSLPYMVLVKFDRGQVLRAANEGYAKAEPLYEVLWDEFPEAGFTEGELQKVFQDTIELWKP